MVALGIVNLALGVPQVLSNGEWGLIYPENPMPGVLLGSLANRNSTGLFLVAGLALLLRLPSPPSLPWFAGLRLGGTLVLRIGGGRTGSRGAIPRGGGLVDS